MNQKNDLVKKALALGISSYQNSNFPQAKALFQKVLQLDDSNFYALHFLGIILLQEQNYKIAQLLLAKALGLKPKDAEVNHHLGLAFKGLGDAERARHCFSEAVKLEPSLAVAHLGYADVVSSMGRYEEAVGAYKTALKHDSTLIKAHNNLGMVYRKKADLVSAIACYKSALGLDPSRLDIHSNLLMCMASTDGVSPSEYLKEAICYGTQARKVAVPYTDWPLLDKSPGKTLNVGFVSGDLRNHPVAAFIESFIGCFDDTKISLTAFSTTSRVDKVSERLKGYFKDWHCIETLTDKDAATLIYQSKVDILIDLSGHTAGNRLPVFAWKPAPIQISWIGYFASTGLEEMDYMLPNTALSPAEFESHYIEKQWHINSAACLQVPEFDVDVAELPASRNGFVTFGSFHSLAKISDLVIETWCEILHQTPNSKLFFKCKELVDIHFREHLIDRCKRLGIEQDRLIMEEGSPLSEYFEAYNRVDIGLDPFPYNSGTVGYHSLWMGVPYIALQGDRILSRIGYSNLSQVGLNHLVADDRTRYVDVAVDLASNIEQLAFIRKGLREVALNSALFNGKKMADELEHVFKEMWQCFVKKSQQ
ncbi:tetratricopeptide repeat protein [Neptuniibacter sp. 2_MG-2023]|uniref:O-linked N-acetylglucosamine transferase, SPINDLY family protein n=1 Tax=Neptuniibacter sp. 2_MG-2023 TaxID=3062671 RepID=UPI0026E4310A|nr:tetratricopeptide repeat protein [Neptuniibacter sp. 2_MG-2023]MDO6514519.1 tetratricopeptide repeat protein [Neptuniibacter sp. 2_MG-2023]